MPADGNAVDEVLSLHIGATGYGHFAIDLAGHGGASDGHADYTLEHAQVMGSCWELTDDGQR
jgi:hypothetical protein